MNPLSGVIDAFRACLVPTKQLDWQLLSMSAVVTFAVFAGAVVYFRKQNARSQTSCSNATTADDLFDLRRPISKQYRLGETDTDLLHERFVAG